MNERLNEIQESDDEDNNDGDDDDVDVVMRPSKYTHTYMKYMKKSSDIQ